MTISTGNRISVSALDGDSAAVSGDATPGNGAAGHVGLRLLKVPTPTPKHEQLLGAPGGKAKQGPLQRPHAHPVFPKKPSAAEDRRDMHGVIDAITSAIQQSYASSRALVPAVSGVAGHWCRPTVV